ncbi:ATP-dependent DNA ligase [Halorientalis pallida]|uniref:DNA ligase n=1 Tax=Halorientalis pallida TaxID=2479928 RepID=A0A498KTL0_9EURY|nr:ATP-dependent DNA ligase [Halorientalis pallida]RXK47996.1 ATP-dependent DNA ligase [Halorientalis pallida]
MEYAEFATFCDRLAATDADLEQVRILADWLTETDADTVPLVVATVRGKVFEPWETAEIGVSSGLTVDAIDTATGVGVDRIERVWSETGDLGDAAAWAVEHETQQSLFSEPLTLERVYETLRELAEFDGEGSQDRRVGEVAGLIADSDPDEARYVVRTALGHMRLGVGDGTMRDAVAAAFLDGSGAASEAVERAHQVTNDYGLVATTARDDGRDGLAALDVELFRPVQTMLAKKAEGLGDGIDDVADEADDVHLEYKYDGARVQIHVDGDDIRVYTRRLEDVTPQFPDVVEAVSEHVTAKRCLLDGELVGYEPETGDPIPFQEFSRRIKRKYDIAEMVERIPVTLYLFDVLSHDGDSLFETPLRDRLDRLDRAFEPDAGVIERATHRARETDTSANDFYQDALAAGHEGVMLKNLAAMYQPGERVGYMVKVKPVMEPLDLVVTRAQWSEGRRSDYLGRLFLGCRDRDGEFAEIGRLSTGYTDEELAALTDKLTALIVSEDGRMVDLRPEVVLEVEYEAIQQSPEYGSGYALRFPRFLDVRDDLSPADVDTIERVETLFEDQ